MEKTQQPNTRAFKRYFKGAPQLEHFYTANTEEQNFVVANGYEYEGIEGYIYETQVPGTVPMYRAAKFDGATGDLVHKYTLDAYELQWLTNYDGWGSDGIQGYVYTTPNPQVSGGIIMGLRCPSATPGYCNGSNASLPNFRDFYFRTGNGSAASTPKRGTTQRMRFSFWSPDFFSDTNHLAFSLHGRFSLGYPDPINNICPSQSQISSSCTWHRGLGMIIFGQPVIQPPHLPPNDWPSRMPNQVFTESWWVAGNDSKNLRGAAQTGSVLTNNRRYSADIRVSDNGNIAYTITDAITGTVVKSDAWNASGQFTEPSSPFPIELTGYTVIDATGSWRDYTMYLTNFRVDWIP
jgi:hypothetical protein